MKTILLLDDHSTVRKMLGTVLRLTGEYCILEAADEVEAIRLCATHGRQINVLIADVMLGCGFGRDIAAQLKNQYPTLRVLFISGYSQEYLVANGALGTGDMFLAKPFTPDKLVEHIGDICRRSRP